MTIFRFRLALLPLFALAGCDKLSQKPNDAICLTPPSLDEVVGPAKSAQEQAELTKGCVHRWSYRLAGAPGSNSEIAKAVIGACREALMVERNFYLNAGETTTLAALEQRKKQLEAEYLEMALFHVVQARAGHCEVK
jgi:hypothetical protein